METLSEVFVTPLLSKLGLHTPVDPTYGRYLMETSPYERALEADTGIKVTSRRVFLDNYEGENVRLVSEELVSARKRSWIFYKTWEKGSGNHCDVIMLHGLNDYGGKCCPHMTGLLNKGFRIIAPDLPTHGRSTGLHMYITSSDQFTGAIEAVILDVDSFSNPKRKIFLMGYSVGGGIAPHSRRQRITGVFGLAPMFGVSMRSIPPPIILRLARVLSYFAGRLPVSKGNRGNISDDPGVEAEFFADPRCYRRKVRLATALALIECMSIFTPATNSSFTTPYCILHGNHDRVTSHEFSVEFHEVAASTDKELEIYEGYEHLILKVGVDKKDDEKRQRGLKDLETWLLQRA